MRSVTTMLVARPSSQSTYRLAPCLALPICSPHHTDSQSCMFSRTTTEVPQPTAQRSRASQQAEAWPCEEIVRLQDCSSTSNEPNRLRRDILRNAYGRDTSKRTKCERNRTTHSGLLCCRTSRLEGEPHYTTPHSPGRWV